MQIYDSEIPLLKNMCNAITASCEIIESSAMEMPDAINDLAMAENLNQDDLFYFKCVMVSSLCNLNDDLMSSDEIWAARFSPEDKPINVAHTDKIIGHMTKAYVIDNEKRLIQHNEGLPSLIHLITHGVLYKVMKDKSERSAMSDLITLIQQGRKFVSMEALFNDFDYALLQGENDYEIIKRDATTAHLTKSLRIFGGSGVYKGRKLVRYLKNLTFSALGIVDNPANPKSVIFSFDSIANTKEVNVMAEKTDGDTQKVVADQLARIVELEKQLANAGTDQLKNRISELEKTNASLVEDLKRAKAESDQCKTDMKKKDENMEASAVLIASLQKELNELKSAKVKAERFAQLQSVVDKDRAETLLASFESLDDKAFEGVLAVLQASVTDKKNQEVAIADDKKADEMLASKNTDKDVNLAVAAKDDGGVSKVIADIQKFYSQE